MTEDLKGFWNVYKVIAGLTLPVIVGMNIAGMHYSVVRVGDMVQTASADMQNATEELYTVDISSKEARCVPTDSESGVTAKECEALALRAMRRK